MTYRVRPDPDSVRSGSRDRKVDPDPLGGAGAETDARLAGHREPWDDRVVLVTGASGYLGALVAARYRAAGATVIAHGRRPVPIPQGSGQWVSVVGDLTSDDAFAGLKPSWRRQITAVVHAAALTRFDATAEEADAVNVEGTRRVLDLALACENLTAFGHLSTVYASGLQGGTIAEELRPATAGFANHYERSKSESEHLVALAGPPRWRILRAATVIADGEDGTVSQYNAFHETLKLWFGGLLPLIPGRAASPLYLTTGNFTAEAIVALMDHPAAGGQVYHLTPTTSACLTLAQAVALVSGTFGESAGYRRRGVLTPPLVDWASFELLGAGVEAFGGALVRRSLAALTPFARQLGVEKDLVNQAFCALHPRQHPDLGPLVVAVCRHLMATSWGRREAG
ncbi:MAG: SDR family oxidoreductase [Acidimicrobiales bacterium]